MRYFISVREIPAMIEEKRDLPGAVLPALPPRNTAEGPGAYHE